MVSVVCDDGWVWTLPDDHLYLALSNLCIWGVAVHVSGSEIFPDKVFDPNRELIMMRRDKGYLFAVKVMAY